MSSKEALETLLAGVDVGGFDAPPKNARQPYFNRFMDIAENALPQNVTGCSGLAWRAYHQHSLDAALALHNAVLPDAKWWAGQEGASVMLPDDFLDAAAEPFSGYNVIPARAWLIAIIKALIAECDE